MNYINNQIRILLFLTLLISITSCKKFIEINPPRTDLSKTEVFQTDETANAAVIDMYYQMSYATGFASGGSNSITLIAGIASDDLRTKQTFVSSKKQINDNAILANNSVVLMLWSDLYNCIYKANSIAENISRSDGLSESVKKELRGEALFVRAFCHFYVTCFWGDAPLALTTDYLTNRSLGRTQKADVYKQLVKDLIEAKTLLPDNYILSNNERIRPNKYAASALLARIYLYQSDWANAEAEASSIIGTSSIFNIVPIGSVFLNNNTEAIWQLFPYGVRPEDLTTSRSYTRLQPDMINAFEAGDQRKVSWVDNVSANKYKLNSSDYTEYSIVFRLAEQVLIRAEARTQLNKIAEAKTDVDIIRTRAGLPGTTANDKISLLLAIEQERRVELFSEWGHRWFDLIRTGRVGNFMPMLKPAWQSTDILFPIPEEQMLRDASMTQNPGY